MIAKTQKIKLLIIVIFFAFASLLLNNFKSQSKLAGPTLGLSPAVLSVSADSIFNIDITLDTKGLAIDGVDVYSLRFDPAKLEVVQVVQGTLMPVTVANKVNNKLGTIMFSQVTNGGTTYTGAGNLATIVFKTKATGDVFVKFDFTPGKSTDTNISSGGVDKLAAVINGTYKIVNVTR